MKKISCFEFKKGDWFALILIKAHYDLITFSVWTLVFHKIGLGLTHPSTSSQEHLLLLSDLLLLHVKCIELVKRLVRCSQNKHWNPQDYKYNKHSTLLKPFLTDQLFINPVTVQLLQYTADMNTVYTYSGHYGQPILQGKCIHCHWGKNNWSHTDLCRLLPVWFEDLKETPPVEASFSCGLLLLLLLNAGGILGCGMNKTSEHLVYFHPSTVTRSLHNWILARLRQCI